MNQAGRPCLSLDQAGGGLAGPAEDFARLLRGLAEGASPLLSRLATDWTNDAMSRGIDYGYGAGDLLLISRTKRLSRCPFALESAQPVLELTRLRPHSRD